MSTLGLYATHATPAAKVGSHGLSLPMLTTGRRDLCPAGALRGYFAMSEQGVRTLERYPIGGFSEYVLSPDANISVIPQSIDLDTAARFGYIGTSYGALKLAGVGAASTVLINGVTGTLGYAAVAIALGLGATKILGIGRNPERLEDVNSMSNKRVEVASSEEEKDIPAWVKSRTGGLGPDVMIDCLGVGGSADTTKQLIKCVKTGGKAILVAGGAEGDVNQSYMEAMSRSVSIVGSTWFTTGEMDDLVALVDAGVIDFSFLEHKRFSLDDVNEAIAFVGDRPGGAVNVVVKPGL
jgi:threonine dehydrogenase-like Zn-dependent dehydrogenase